jgi:hypothetical protein
VLALLFFLVAVVDVDDADDAEEPVLDFFAVVLDVAVVEAGFVAVVFWVVDASCVVAAVVLTVSVLWAQETKKARVARTVMDKASFFIGMDGSKRHQTVQAPLLRQGINCLAAPHSPFPWPDPPSLASGALPSPPHLSTLPRPLRCAQSKCWTSSQTMAERTAAKVERTIAARRDCRTLNSGLGMSSWMCVPS